MLDQIEGCLHFANAGITGDSSGAVEIRRQALLPPRGPRWRGYRRPAAAADVDCRPRRGLDAEGRGRPQWSAAPTAVLSLRGGEVTDMISLCLCENPDHSFFCVMISVTISFELQVSSESPRMIEVSYVSAHGPNR
jgi:hypothetical protein